MFALFVSYPYVYIHPVLKILLPHFHTIPALYLLYPCSWTLTAFAEILYFVHCYKQSMALFKEPQAA